MINKIEIKDKNPILDYIILVAKELSRSNYCEIEAPLNNIGKIVDLEHAIYELDPSVNKKVVIELSNGTTEKINLVRDEENPLIEITLKEHLSSNDLKEKLYEDCLILGPSGSISANAVGTKKSPGRNFLEKKLYKYLPKPKDGILIRMGYMAPSPFFLFTRYEDSKPSKKINGVEIYPVSISPEYKLDEKSFNFLRDPLFWDAWSQYYSHFLNIISGKDTLKGIVESYKEDLNHFKEHIKKARDGVFIMINVLINYESTDTILERFGCPPKYIKHYLLKPLKTLNYIVLDSWDKGNYGPIKNLINCYNNYVKEYRPGWSKIENIEQLVRAVQLSKNQGKERQKMRRIGIY